MKELPAEDQAQGARFNERYWALAAACRELGGAPMASERYRQHTLRVLEEMQEEIGASFRMWREARGIPEL